MVGGGNRGYGGGGCNNMNSAATLQNDGITCSTDALEAFFISTSSPSIHGSRSMVNFENVGRGSALERSFFQSHDQEENADEDFDDCFRQPEKKRRLTVDQVQFLEKNFEVENKLEPERKIQLAKDLGLQPRQVAIWFQNRRARWKTKQLEKDYDALKSSYDALKISYENLLKEKEKLKNEVLMLTNKQLISEKEKGNSELQDHSKEQSHHPQPISASSLVSEERPCSEMPKAMAVCKQEDLSSANSDVFDSDSPHYTDGVHSSSLLEPADSSHAFEPDHSDLSQDEEDNFSKNLVPPMYTGFLKLEDDVYTDQPASSCNYGFPVEDQALWFWSS